MTIAPADRGSFLPILEEAPDFTEARFRVLLAFAQAHYRFEPFGTDCVEPHVLWRHDVDFSMHDALRIATIEAEAGARATYFLLLTSPYYSLLETDARRMARRLAELGHHVGLHFDATCYADDSDVDLETRIVRERQVLEDIVAAPVSTIAFHIPAHSGMLEMTRSHLGGLLNVYGGRVRSDYTYASDSFGIWRFRPIHEVLLACDKPRLHILTHPILWSPDPLPVRRKIARCLAERAAAGQALYDHLVRSAGMWDAVMAQEDQEL